MHNFHPITAKWFRRRFKQPTAPQIEGWPAIRSGEDTLIAAPTGSGKTLTAFLVCIDKLIRDGIQGDLSKGTKVLYISPLKALSHDIRRNLETPLGELQAYAEAAGETFPEIRAVVRTGDTPTSVRAAMVRRPPDILVTTPESLFLILGGEKSREMLRTVETVIVDEIHALARDKRGSHLALSLARLDHLTEKPAQRIGLSATQKPLELVARFLTGGKKLSNAHDSPNKSHKDQTSHVHGRLCRIIDVGHQRKLDLGIETPKTDLSAVCSHEQWDEVYHRIKELVESHRSTVVFVNTRKLAERIAFHLSQHMGDEAVASHHGSLAKDRRLDAEERLKRGELKVIVATASLELGIDIGFIDLVVQIGSPRSIATFLQRVGRSGHSLGALPKGRLFVLTRDELMESMAMIRAVRAGRLDSLEIPRQPLDILAQQIIAACAADEWSEDDLYQMLTSAYPYRHLTREEFNGVVRMVAEGFAKGRTRFSYIHHDMQQKRLRGKRGARLAASMSGGAIPDQGDYRVVMDGDGTFVGTLNEDFAIESAAGDIFLLGNTSWQIVHVRGGEVVVRDAHGAPPTIPFWLGEAPGRTVELSDEVSKLREMIAAKLTLADDPDDPLYRLESLEAIESLDPPQYCQARAWLEAETGASTWAAIQATHYVAVQKAAMGVIPTQDTVVFERFFDESGGMQLVIHAPFGMRINRGWGLAMRKRFCRSFDFELQASADDNGIVLSLGPQHSFPIEQLFSFLNENNVRALLEQAILQVPLFQVRWRWNTTRSLAVLRNQSGKRIPPALQRFRADDLMTAVFPAQTQCKEHVTGDIELPDHPLVAQTMHDCLTEAIDIDRLVQVIGRIAKGEVRMVSRDTREPSPFSYQLLNAYPYAFLDDAPLEERRARAVATRRGLSIEALRDLGALDQEAVAQVVKDAWPIARDADELHDVLATVGVIPEIEVDPRWQPHFESLQQQHRATRCKIGNVVLWTVAVNLPLVNAAYPGCAFDPAVAIPDLDTTLLQEWSSEEAIQRILAGYLEIKGICTTQELSRGLNIPENHVEANLRAIEALGTVLQGRFHQPHSEDRENTGNTIDASGAQKDQQVPLIQWCDRRLLTRIHRLTLDGLRRQIKPVSPRDFMRFLFRHQHLSDRYRAQEHDLFHIIHQLQGFTAGAASWERDILPARVHHYRPSELDGLCHAGDIAWGRIDAPQRTECKTQPSTQKNIHKSIPIAFLVRDHLADLLPPNLPVHQHLTQDGSPNRSTNKAGKNPNNKISHEENPNEGARTSEGLTSLARDVYHLLQSRGALFFREMQQVLGLLDAQLEEALNELTRFGLVSADGFQALRPILADSKRARQAQRGLPGRMRPRVALGGGGRWSLFPGLYADETAPRRRSGKNDKGENHGKANATNGNSLTKDTGIATAGTHATDPHKKTMDPSREAAQTSIDNPSQTRLQKHHEQWAWTLLTRYGVIFRDLLARESAAPTWGELAPLYRRLEAQGKIRGGRFVSGVGGEQYALPDAVDRLRAVRNLRPMNPENPTEISSGPQKVATANQLRQSVPPTTREEVQEALCELVVVSAQDPTNLVGIVQPGERVPANRNSAIAYCNGEPVAIRGPQQEIQYLRQDLHPDQKAEIRRRLTLDGPLRYRSGETASGHHAEVGGR